MTGMHRVAPSPLSNPIPQIVEDQFLVCAISNITCVGCPPMIYLLTRLDQPDADSQRLINGTQTLGVTARKVIVDGHHMHRDSRQGGRNRRKKGDDRLAFTRAHLDKAALQKRKPTHQLNRVVPQPNFALCRLPNECKTFGDGSTTNALPQQPWPESRSISFQFVIIHRPHTRRETFNSVHDSAMQETDACQTRTP